MAWCSELSDRMGALDRGVYCLGVAANASAGAAAEAQRQKALERLESHRQRKHEAKMAIEYARQKREQDEAVRREEERLYRIQMDAIRAEEANQRAMTKMQKRMERVQRMDLANEEGKSMLEAERSQEHAETVERLHGWRERRDLYMEQMKLESNELRDQKTQSNVDWRHRQHSRIKEQNRLQTEADKARAAIVHDMKQVVPL